MLYFLCFKRLLNWANKTQADLFISLLHNIHLIDSFQPLDMPFECKNKGENNLFRNCFSIKAKCTHRGEYCTCLLQDTNAFICIHTEKVMSDRTTQFIRQI